MQEFISLSFFSYFITYSLRDFFHENIKFFISNIMNTFFFLMENRTLINRIILDIDFFFRKNGFHFYYKIFNNE